MDTGFSIRVEQGQCTWRLHSTAASRHLVSTANAQGGTLLLFGRLYYHADLRRRLTNANTLTTDAELLLHLLLQHGIAGLVRVEGDYAFAMWDGTQRRLIIGRDPLGGFPLYYSAGAVFHADTSLNRLRTANSTIDHDYLADAIMVGGSLSEVGTDRTVWHNVRRVRSGTAIVWDGQQGTTHRYWDWLRHIEVLASTNPQELSVEIRQRLSAAVQERMGRTTACHLSGGLDSTAVANLAANHLPASQRLHTVSVVYDALTSLHPERPYLDEALRARQEFQPHLVQGDRYLDFDGFHETPRTEEPYSGWWRIPMDRSTLDAACHARADVLMTGLGGDELFESFPYHLADDVRRGRFIKAWREASRWAHSMHLNAWDLLYPFGIANAWPVWSRMGWGMHLYPTGDISLANEWQLPDWIQPAYATRYALRERMAAGLRDHYTRCRPTMVSMLLHTVERRVGNTVAWTIGVDRGLTVVHPILDPRLISLAFGIHSRLTPQPDGQKPHFRRAIADLLPPSLLARRTKGHFNELFYRGMARNLPTLERLLREPEVADLGMIDASKLLTTLKKATVGALGVRPVHFAVTTLTILHWLVHALRQSVANTPRPQEPVDRMVAA